MDYHSLKTWGKYSFSSLILGYAAINGAAWATTCSDAETVKNFQNKGDFRGALQELDNCLSTQQSLANQDIVLFNELLKQVLAPNPTTSLDESYRNFQSVLKTHLLSALKFELADYFKTNPEADGKLFTEIRQPEEQYYFYYDTGRMISHSRGIALTNKALLWKNLTGEPQRLGFDDINHMTLVYELGLSLTGWEIRVNHDEANDIRLSGVPDKVIQPLVAAIVYFINANKTIPTTMLNLEVPDREVAILAGWVTLCHDKYTSQADPIKDLQAIDTCLATYGKDFKLSQTDKELIHQLSNQILTPADLDLEAGYDNFKAILNTHFFSELKLNFKDDFNPQRQAELFKEANSASDPYYFYFDTGKLATDSRGIALTNKAIIWKNLLGSSVSWDKITGSASYLPLEKITHISLIYEIGLSSLGGWKLRLNEEKNHDNNENNNENDDKENKENNDDNDIVLSQLSVDNVELFASALVYFINIAANTQLTLQIPPATQEVLTKTFLERHPQIKSITDSVFSLFTPKSAEETTATPTEETTAPVEDSAATSPSSESSESEAPETVTPSEDAATSTEDSAATSPASETEKPQTVTPSKEEVVPADKKTTEDSATVPTTTNSAMEATPAAQDLATDQDSANEPTVSSDSSSSTSETAAEKSTPEDSTTKETSSAEGQSAPPAVDTKESSE
jgi:hypothetical protein